MAISVNQEVPEISDRTLVTGLANLSITGLNPSKADLEKLGYKPKDEPVYLDTNSKSGESQIRIDVHLKGTINVDGEDEPVTVSTKAAFFIENSSSRGMHIDKFGKYAKDKSKLDASAQPAYNGQIELIGFLKALCNVRPGEECALDHMDKLVTVGDLKELQDTMRSVIKARGKDNPHVQALLGIRDGKYQDVFTNRFDYVGRGGSDYLHKQVVKQADYDRTNNRALTYYGPVNTLSEQYVPSQYVARKFTPEAQEAFEFTLPKGTFGQAAGFPGGAQVGAFPGAAPQPQFQQPGQQFGGVAVGQAQPFHQAPVAPTLQPVYSDDDNDLPF